MRIHKEGIKIILSFFVFSLLLILLIAALHAGKGALCIISAILLIILSFITFFFRSPKSKILDCANELLSPADGRVVIVKEVYEDEFFKERMLQVSIFMSIFDVHVNWYPIAGKVIYYEHHNGDYLVAWHPKSSEKNEHTTIVMENENGRYAFRQIAGILARRIVCNAAVGKEVEQGSEVGIIKFGSRVDIFLPLDTEINVKRGDRVKGRKSVIATLK